MCELCLCSGGHVPGCPYYESPYPTERRKSVFVCRICGKAIYHGDEVIDIAGGEEFVHADCFCTASHDTMLQKGVFLHTHGEEGVCEVCGKAIPQGEPAVDFGEGVHLTCFRALTPDGLLQLLEESVQTFELYN